MIEERDASGRRRVFHLLDAMRGIAAVAVVQRHSMPTLGATMLPGTYLAVDLFFVLSGFVLAHAYDERLSRGMPLGRFLALRLIRLYPLYLVGLGLGLIALVGQIHSGRQAPSPAEFAIICVLGLTMLPRLGPLDLNFPRWSLTYEVLVNIVYAVLAPVLTISRLAWIVFVSGLALAISTGAGYGVEAGWYVKQFPIGVARVTFSFFAGVLCYRHYAGTVGGRTLAWLAAALALLWAGAVPVTEQSWYLRDLACVFCVFPVLVAVAARLDVGGRTAAVCAFLGVVSYAIYLIHRPVGSILSGAAAKAGFDIAAHQPWSGIAFIVLLLAASWWLDRFYDKPARRWLTARLGPLEGDARGGERRPAPDRSPDPIGTGP